MSHYIVAQSWWHQVAPACYGYSACKPGHSFGPAVREYYLLHYIFEGEGKFFRGGEEFFLSAGDIFVIRPGEVTTYCASKTNPWKYSWLGFHLPTDSTLFQDPVIRQASMRSVFSCIRDHHLNGKMDGKIFSLTYELLWELTKDAPPKKRSSNSYAQYAKTYMDYNYMRRITIQEIADQIHVERRYLTTVFRRAYGISPQSYLMGVRLDKAREFLELGFSVKEAAVMSGYLDVPNFSRQYKSRFGNSPGCDRVNQYKINDKGAEL